MLNSNPKLGIIGIGLMGRPMTLRLLQHGFLVNVWNRSPEKLQPVIDAGAKAASSIAELVRASDVIILCLADTQAVESAIHHGILENGNAEKLVIDLSSIDPNKTRQFASVLNENCGMGWVDAPVSGGVSGAEQGTLTIMTGGRPEHIDIARHVLRPVISAADTHGTGRQRTDHQDM